MGILDIILCAALFLGTLLGLWLISDNSYIIVKRREYRRINELLKYLEDNPRNMKAVEAYIVRDVYEAMRKKYRHATLCGVGNLLLFIYLSVINYWLYDQPHMLYLACIVGGVAMWAYNEHEEMYMRKWDKNVYKLHEKMERLSYEEAKRVYEYAPDRFSSERKMWVATITYLVRKKFGEGVYDESAEIFMKENDNDIWMVIKDYYIEKNIPYTSYIWRKVANVREC